LGGGVGGGGGGGGGTESRFYPAKNGGGQGGGAAPFLPAKRRPGIREKGMEEQHRVQRRALAWKKGRRPSLAVGESGGRPRFGGEDPVEALDALVVERDQGNDGRGWKPGIPSQRGVVQPRRRQEKHRRVDRFPDYDDHTKVLPRTVRPVRLGCVAGSRDMPVKAVGRRLARPSIFSTAIGEIIPLTAGHGVRQVGPGWRRSDFSRPPGSHSGSYR